MSLDRIWKIVGKAAKVLAVVTPIAALGWLMISLSIAPFKTDVAHLRKDVTEVRQGLTEMREEQAVMRGEMKSIREGQAALRAEVAELREGQATLRAEMSNVSGIVGTLVNLLQGQITLVPAPAPASAEERSDEMVALEE